MAVWYLAIFLDGAFPLAAGFAFSIPPAAWPKIAAARGLTVDSAKTRWGQIKRKFGLNTTAKPLPEPANRVRKAAAGCWQRGGGEQPGRQAGCPRTRPARPSTTNRRTRSPTEPNVEPIIKNEKHSIVSHRKACRPELRVRTPTLFLSTPTPTADVDVEIKAKDGETKYQCQIEKPDETGWEAIIKNESTASAPTAASMIATIPANGLRIRVICRTIHGAPC
ncbi:hypothetical protein DL767_003276 [Monosporascus sp. MG133]|nr:hypothetical protein DL767_003276 [Monosporascus sp. MG133]